MAPSIPTDLQRPAGYWSYRKVGEAILVGNLWAYTGVMFYAFLWLARHPKQTVWKFPRQFMPVLFVGLLIPPWLVRELWRRRRQDRMDLDTRELARRGPEQGRREQRNRRRRGLDRGESERQEPERQEPEQDKPGQAKLEVMEFIPRDLDPELWEKIAPYIGDNNEFDITRNLPRGRPEAARAA